MSDVSYGSKRRPVVLDFSQIIRRVNWVVGGNILTLDIQLNVDRHEPGQQTLLKAMSDTFNVFTETINKHDDKLPVAELENPFTPDMIDKLYIWSRAPFTETGGENQTRHKRAIIFFNLSKIKSKMKADSSTGATPIEFEFQVLFPPGQNTTQDETTYWAYYDPFGNPFEYYMEHPQSSGAIIDEFGNTGVFVFPRAFGTAAERDQFLGYNAGSLPPMVGFDEPNQTTVDDNLNWEIRAETHKKTKDYLARNFPTNSRNEPGWDEDKATDTATESESSPDLMPAFTVTVTVKFSDLSVTMEKNS